MKKLFLQAYLAFMAFQMWLASAWYLRAYRSHCEGAIKLHKDKVVPIYKYRPGVH